MVLDEFLKDKDFGDIMLSNCYELLLLLVQKSRAFHLICDTNFVKYSPKLPKGYIDTSLSYIVFYISDESVASFYFDKERLSFEACFGEDNFVSLVSLSLKGISKIQLQRDIIFTNPAIYEKDEEDLLQDSINVFLNNPKNKNIFKK